MGFGKRLLAGAIAVGVVMAGAATLVQPAEAASTGVKVAAVKTGNGTITTPSVSASGKAKVTSKAYKITKSGKKVATTSTAGKKIKVSSGTYKVKTTVKYKVGKKKKSYTKTSTVSVKKTATNSSVMTYSEYQKISNGMTPAEVKAVVGGSGTRTWYYESTYDEYVCDDSYENCWYEARRTVYADYDWKNTSKYGRGSVSFENGRVTYKYWSS